MARTASEIIAYVGCYTTPDRDGRGEGISAYRVDEDSGAWRSLGLVATLPNPSFLALHPNGRFLYCVHGGNFSTISAFSISAEGLTQLGTVSSGGMNPAHLDVDASGRW